MSSGEARERAYEALKLVGLEGREKALPNQLSGGQQQRVCIARALVTDSALLLADEPTGALDSVSRKLIFETLRNLASQGKCVFMVTHDIELASKTDRALILKDGKISRQIIKPSADELYQALESSKD